LPQENLARPFKVNNILDESRGGFSPFSLLGEGLGMRV